MALGCPIRLTEGHISMEMNGSIWLSFLLGSGSLACSAQNVETKLLLQKHILVVVRGESEQM
jgi:hypothetical protein